MESNQLEAGDVVSDMDTMDTIDVVVTSEATAGEEGPMLVTDGALASWNGATGSNTIDVLLGYALYNTAAVFFVDAQGRGRVMVLGGASRSTSPQPSAGVVYY